jgi:hypothetical protein
VTTTLALDTDQAKTLGIWIIVGVLVVGVISALIIRAIVGKIIALLIVVGLAAYVYVERDNIQSAVKKCDATFFGVHLTPSNPDLKQKCQDIGK